MAKNSVRERELNQKVHYPASFRLSGGNWVVLTAPITKEWKGRQITASEGHRKTKGAYHEGGPFFTSRIQPSINTRMIDFLHPGGWPKYSGPCNVPGVPIDKLSGLSTPSQDSSYLDPVGAEAISIVDPTNPNAQTGVAIGEIARDGLPIPGIQAWRRRTEVAKGAASEYLNAVFGWLPLVSDMQDTAQSVLDGNTILKGYRDNAGGSGVHREFQFDDIEAESESVIAKFASAEVCGGQTSFNYSPTPQVPVTRNIKTITRRWFSGRFTYASPDRNDTINGMLGYSSEAEKLFGLPLTPDLVWELTPWSWAVDWFSNAGSVVHNLSSFKLGGLVMRYGYIMEETSTTITYSMPATGITGVPGTVPPSVITSVTKRRRPANPFGFGLSWEGLSPAQLLITAALGISRLR